MGVLNLFLCVYIHIFSVEQIAFTRQQNIIYCSYDLRMNRLNQETFSADKTKRQTGLLLASLSQSKPTLNWSSPWGLKANQN